MLGLIDINGNYYEAEHNITGATEVPLRPSANHVYQGGAWVHVAPTQAEIDAAAVVQAKADLAAACMASLPDILAYIASKPDSPASLKANAASAAANKAKIK